jgi:ATP-binding cassette subfamily B (MDR/TAP) protein 10
MVRFRHFIYFYVFIRKMSLQVFSAIIRQETAFFDKNKTGELINRLSADSQLVSQTVTQQVRPGRSE